MLYDLNVAWSPTSQRAELENILQFSHSLGYNIVALNQTLNTLPLPVKIVNPIPQLTSPPANYPQPLSTSNNDALPGVSDALPKLPAILRRVTVVIEDPTANHRLRELAAAYDIVAVRPTSEKAFQAACTSLSEHSIISLDLTQFFPFHFKPKPCMAAVNKGLRFEICYSQLVGGGSAKAAAAAAGPVDARARANFIANLVGLLRATKGRGMIVSSEAASPLGLRAPADVVNLLAVWGLSPDKGVDAIGLGPRGIVMNEGIKRRGFRGMVDVVESEGKLPTAITGPHVDGIEASTKRKQPVGAAASTDQEGDEAPMSKRQAKKLRLAKMRADTSASDAAQADSKGAKNP